MASSIASPATSTAPPPPSNFSGCNFSCAKAPQNQSEIEPGRRKTQQARNLCGQLSPRGECRSSTSENEVMSDAPIMEVGHVDFYPASIQSHPDGIRWIGLGARCCWECVPSEPTADLGRIYHRRSGDQSRSLH